MPDNILLNGEVGDESAELLHEFVHPHDHAGDALLEDPATLALESDGDKAALECERAERAQQPWWKRPSAWW
jgi:hypothetical protein